MSLQMTVARYGHQGDPGLFGFLGGVIKGGVTGFLTGGPAGAVMGAMGGAGAAIAGAGTRPSVTQARAAVMFPTVSTARPQLPGGFSGVNVGGPYGITAGRTTGPGITPAAPARPTPLLPSGSTAQYAPKACGLSGYHYNKTTYHTAGGTVPRGTKCVKNRKRNPLNPRALSRAMSRVASAQRAVRCLSLFAGPAARASHAANNGKGKLFGGRGKKACRCK